MTDVAHDVPTILATLPLFSEVSPEQLASLAAMSRFIRLKKEELLFQRGDDPSGLFSLINGQVKLAVSSPQGNEKVVEIVGPGQTFGEAVMFMDRSYPVFCEALCDTSVLLVRRQAVFDLLEQDPTFARRMLAGMSVRLHMMVRDVESYALRNATQRVVGYLLQDPQLDSDATGQQTLFLSASKQVIASRLNLTPETLSRVFHVLDGEGLIQVEGKRIQLLDLHRLREFTD